MPLSYIGVGLIRTVSRFMDWTWEHDVPAFLVLVLTFVLGLVLGMVVR